MRYLGVCLIVLGVMFALLELARLAKVGRSTIGALENQQQGAQPRIVRQLAEALGVTPADLYGES
jgi:hypothetical protein